MARKRNGGAPTESAQTTYTNAVAQAKATRDAAVATAKKELRDVTERADAMAAASYDYASAIDAAVAEFESDSE